MPIVDSQIHIWQNGKMSPHHRQDATFSYDDALAESFIINMKGHHNANP